MKKLLVFTVILLVFSGKGFTQNADAPWAMEFGLNWVDFHGLKEGPGDGFNTMKFQGGLGELSFSRYLCRYADFQFTTGFADFDKNKYDSATTYGAVLCNNISFFDLDLHYKFLSHLKNPPKRIVPYLDLGVGWQYFNDATQFKTQVGLGVDFWFLENLAIFARWNFDRPTDKDIVNYWHSAIGLKYQFACGFCRDRDKDGIADNEDRCPETFGIASLQGCPDRDGDGIADIDDKCPDVKGLASLKGCPDRDGDGIADAEDKCPDQAGLKEFQGCPDKDGDGIVDSEDDCPDVKGISKFKGCPDTDGDGIMDKLDDCPTIAGLEKFKGCPDTDGDGIPDKDDKCPKVAGTAANKGCPEIAKEVKEQIQKIAKSIYFETGKATIKKESFPKLDELITIVNKYPELKITIEGHTDNVGNDASNLKLSQDRVESVKAYLTGKGVSAGRLTATGYGETKPIAPNTTASGRQQNRRVEITADY